LFLLEILRLARRYKTGFFKGNLKHLFTACLPLKTNVNIDNQRRNQKKIGKDLMELTMSN
jgi:hypothetical protein